MNKVKVITDSCADMNKELREKYDVDYARMSVSWDGKDIAASTDWDLYSVKDFYNAMRGGTRIITNQVPQGEFVRVFELYLEQGYDIVYIACSSALSGSYNLSRNVAKTLEEKYLDRKIICVDPKTSCGGEMITTVEAAKKAAAGASAEEVAAYAEEIAKATMQYCTADSLTYLKRAGRVKASAAFFGNLFGIKPVIISNDNGENEAVKKVKGRKASMDTCIDMLKASMAATNDKYPVSEQTVVVVHADADEDAAYLAERVKNEIQPKEVYVTYIGPIIGASVGPGAVALYALGDQNAVLGSK